MIGTGVAFYASEAHFADHLLPIYQAARGLDIGATFHETVPPGDGLVVVAGIGDYKRARGRPIVFVEHGTGQSYGGHHANHPGGTDRERTVLFICPNERTSAPNRARYPDVPAPVVGCPKLDRYFRDGGDRQPKSSPVVALSFHWDSMLVPEARSAWGHYRTALPRIGAHVRSLGGTLLGHGHPRMMRHLEPAYRAAGIEIVHRFDEVLERASLYLIDNSSTGFEFLATDRPIVWLNCPWYRRSATHGLRFWDAADAAVQCDDPELVPAAIDLALTDPFAIVQRRHEVTEELYPMRDGHAAERAAQAIAEVLVAQDRPASRHRVRPVAVRPRR